jgi:hypothetical protein
MYYLSTCYRGFKYLLLVLGLMFLAESPWLLQDDKLLDLKHKWTPAIEQRPSSYG